MPSIDSFLEKAEKYKWDGIDYIGIGKYAIAKFLLEKEHLSSLSTDNNNWYKHLWDKIHHYSDELNDNHILANGKIKFITFNYDLSLEYFLLSSIRYSYIGYYASQEDIKNLINFIKKIHIIHIYGKLGPLPWEGDRREYGNYESRDILEYSKGIKIIQRDAETTEELKTAHEYLKQADFVCFLGFGYNFDNLERLNLLNATGNYDIKKIYGTAKGLKKAQKENITSYLDHQDSESVTLGNEDEGIIDFLNKEFDHLW